LTVRLVGPPGNPQAIGARVQVVWEDATQQTAEVYAGSGYLSQSTSDLVFGANGQSVQSIEVTWPDGRVTEQQPPANATFLRIVNPD
jgi:accessory colonization factor AcfC